MESFLPLLDRSVLHVSLFLTTVNIDMYTDMCVEQNDKSTCDQSGITGSEVVH